MPPPARSVGRPRTLEVPEGYYLPEAVEARRAYQRAYKAANRDGLKTYYRTWREGHREQTVGYNRAYYARVSAARRLNPGGAAQAEPEAVSA